MSIDLEAAEVEGGDPSASYAGFNMYFLSRMPEVDKQMEFAKFAKGLPLNQMEGAMISIRQAADQDKDMLKASDDQTSFNIELKLYDE